MTDPAVLAPGEPIPTLTELVDGLNARGYRACTAGLGGNIIGIEITTTSGYAWVLAADDMWHIGRDDDKVPDDRGPAAYAEFCCTLPLLIDWADQIMGCDR